MFEKLFTVMYYSIYKYCCVLRFDTYLRLYVVFHKSKLFISMQCFLSFAKTKILRENVMKYLNALSLFLSQWNETFSECLYCFMVATNV